MMHGRCRAPYIFMVSMDVAPETDSIRSIMRSTFPNLMKLPGVLDARRLKAEPSFFNIAGEEKAIANPGVINYALYQIDGPHCSPAPPRLRPASLYARPPL
jgi:hypothetical protein